MLLRGYTVEDAAALPLLADDAAVSYYMAASFPNPYTEAAARWWIATGCRDGIHQAIEVDGQLAGGVGVTFKSGERARCALVGYWLGRKYWGRGLAAQALKQLTEFVFANTEINRLEAAIYHPNRSSFRVAEKAGYHCEAIHRQAIYKNNEFYDEHLYVCLKKA